MSHTTATKLELAGMLADSQRFEGTATASRQETIERYRGSTRQFLLKAVSRRMGTARMPMVEVGPADVARDASDREDAATVVAFPVRPATRTPGVVEIDAADALRAWVRINGEVVASIVRDLSRGTYQAMASGMCLTGQVTLDEARAEVVRRWSAFQL